MSETLVPAQPPSWRSTLALLRRVLGFLRPHRSRFLGGVGLTLAGIALDLVKPVPLALGLNHVLDHQPLPGWLAPLAGGWARRCGRSRC